MIVSVIAILDLLLSRDHFGSTCNHMMTQLYGHKSNTAKTIKKNGLYWYLSGFGLYSCSKRRFNSSNHTLSVVADVSAS